MKQAIPRLVAGLTGRFYRGRVVSGCEDRRQEGWITIVAATTKEEPDLSGYCGLGTIGASPGRMWFNEEGHYSCTRASFRELFVHELGHAMGFRHVPNGYGHAMAPGEYTGSVDFSPKERQHAQLAYKRGRYARYCEDARACSSAAAPGGTALSVEIVH